MQVVELSDSRDATERHFEKCHARGVIDIFRSKARRGAVHHFSPGPETVLFVLRTMFRAPANYTLEGMRVCINKPGENGAIGETDRLRSVVALASGGSPDVFYHTVRIDGQRS